jgi:hypothetical protein
MWMAFFVRKTKWQAQGQTKAQRKNHAIAAYLATAILLSVSASCFGEDDVTASASVEISQPVVTPEVSADPQCSSVVLSCNSPVRPIAPEHTLLDSAATRDEAQRAQSQADQTAAEQDLQRRIEFARQHPNAIFVYGNKSTPKESVSDVFNRALGVTTTDLTTSSYDSMGRRTECVSACHGPLCCVTTSSAADNTK